MNTFLSKKESRRLRRFIDLLTIKPSRFSKWWVLATLATQIGTGDNPTKRLNRLALICVFLIGLTKKEKSNVEENLRKMDELQMLIPLLAKRAGKEIILYLPLQ